MPSTTNIYTISLHDALPILILDEPVNGLDPEGIVEIRKLFQELAENDGVTILISSHLLSEVAKIATKIGIIHEGQLIQEIEAKQLNQLLKDRYSDVKIMSAYH